MTKVFPLHPSSSPPNILYMTLLALRPLMNACVSKLCLVPEAEINMKSVTNLTQINIHTVDSQFHRVNAGVCVGVCVGFGGVCVKEAVMFTLFSCS